MKNNKDPRIKVLIYVGIAIFTFSAIMMAFTVGQRSSSSPSSSSSSSSGTPKYESSETRHAFGDIPMSVGKVTKIFDVKNSGDADLEISDISTSCMCTEARFIVDGKRSPAFGMKGHGKSPTFWKGKLEPGQEGQLEVIYDPNAHGPSATGPITRTVTVVSNTDGVDDSRTVYTVTGKVVK